MQAPGSAQLDLIRRYNRTLRQLQTEALRAPGARDVRVRAKAVRRMATLGGAQAAGGAESPGGPPGDGH